MDIDNMANEILENIENKPAAKKQNVYVRAGKGRKLCPDCGSYVGVRTSFCECGHEFIKGQSTNASTADKNSQFEEPLSDEDKRYIRAIGCGKGGRVIYAAAGECPAKLLGIDYESVSNFCDDVVFSGFALGKIYMPGAIKNWARHVITLPETVEKVADMIDQWYDAKVISTMGIEV